MELFTYILANKDKIQLANGYIFFFSFVQDAGYFQYLVPENNNIKKIMYQIIFRLQ
jgi:hypothetical protein